MIDRETWNRAVLNDLELSNGKIAPNRIMRAATWMGQADAHGMCGDEIIGTYGKISAGIVVTGFQYVMSEGQAVRRMISNSKPEDVEGLTRLAAAIHSTGSLAAAQLVHCGGRSYPKYAGTDVVFGPSDMEIPQPKGDIVQVKAMTVDYVERVTQAYADAATRAADAGFDVIELHGAHHYGLWQFFDPTYNKRPLDDPYTGATLDGRCKAMLDAVRAIKTAIDIPIQVKVDSRSVSVVPEDVGELTKRLAEAGAYCVIFSGPNASQDHKKVGEAYFLNDALTIKSIARESGLLFGLVGGIRSPETIVRLLTGDGNLTDAFDVIQLSRPFISEPFLLLRWSEEMRTSNQHPARCISCNRCFQAGFKCKVECIQFKESQH
ncbi:MAG: hypothetical protein ACFFF4_06460 [Candidatus Thorarchaeota archaeon]